MTNAWLTPPRACEPRMKRHPDHMMLGGGIFVRPNHLYIVGSMVQ